MKKYLFFILYYFLLSDAKSQSLLTVAEIYDYNIGDVFITKYGGYSTPPTYEKKTITNKYYSSSLDTLFYNWDGYSYTSAGCQTCSPSYSTIVGGTMFYSHLTDTVGLGLGSKIHYWNFNCIDTAGYTGIWVDTIFNNPTYCNIPSLKISSMGNGPQLLDSCYSYFEPYYGYDEYGKGIGQESHYYNTCSNGFPNCEMGMILLFYKKGADSCGTQPLITNIHELKLLESFSVSPNPFSLDTHITFFKEQNNSVITITNIYGNELKRINFSGNQLTFDREGLINGLYFIRINEGTNIYSSKLIIQE